MSLLEFVLWLPYLILCVLTDVVVEKYFSVNTICKEATHLSCESIGRWPISLSQDHWLTYRYNCSSQERWYFPLIVQWFAVYRSEKLLLPPWKQTARGKRKTRSTFEKPFLKKRKQKRAYHSLILYAPVTWAKKYKKEHIRVALSFFFSRIAKTFPPKQNSC